MDKELSKQYNGIAEDYTSGNPDYNQFSRETFYNVIVTDLNGKKLLDVACGDGKDLRYFSNLGAIVEGIDASSDMIELARLKLPQIRLLVGDMENLPYEKDSFDYVTSKYAIQTSMDVPKVLREMGRVLRPGGQMIYLAVHPFRQFIEKKKTDKDYFQQEIVASTFFEGAFTAYEPSHTMQEYLNPDFLNDFTIDHFGEYADFPSVERIGGDNYPCFLILKATKKD